MVRTDINPWEWSKVFGYSQAVDMSGASHVRLCSGQTAMDDDGVPPTTSNMAAQIEKTAANLSAVLAAAGMTLDNVVRLTIYTTDVDEFLASYDTAAAALGSNMPAMSLLGVSRLAFPEIKLEVEATAVS